LRKKGKMMARSDAKEKFVFPFEKLEVWQLAIELADFVLALLESLPPHRHTRLIGQMEAAVCSIAQNIAEGKGRQYLDFPHFFRARGEVAFEAGP